MNRAKDNRISDGLTTWCPIRYLLWCDVNKCQRRSWGSSSDLLKTSMSGTMSMEALDYIFLMQLSNCEWKNIEIKIKQMGRIKIF